MDKKIRSQVMTVLFISKNVDNYELPLIYILIVLRYESSIFPTNRNKLRCGEGLSHKIHVSCQSLQFVKVRKHLNIQP